MTSPTISVAMSIVILGRSILKPRPTVIPEVKIVLHQAVCIGPAIVLRGSTPFLYNGVGVLVLGAELNKMIASLLAYFADVALRRLPIKLWIHIGRALLKQVACTIMSYRDTASLKA